MAIKLVSKRKHKAMSLNMCSNGYQIFGGSHSLRLFLHGHGGQENISGALWQWRGGGLNWGMCRYT